jgi:hypothetical protein
MMRTARRSSLLGLLLTLGCAGSEVTPPTPGTAGNGAAGATGGDGSGGTGPAGAGGGASGSAGSGPAGAGGSDVAGAAGAAGAAGGGAGRGGAAGGGATGGQSGSSGAGGRGGAAGGGVAGGGGGVACTITPTATMSTQIPTVFAVTFTTTLTGFTSGSIQFGLAGAAPMVAPVDMAAASYRTLLLGMKGNRDYVYRIVLNGSGGSCTSPDYMIRTGAVPTSVPRPTRMMMNAAAHQPGFIITSGGSAMGGGGGAIPVYILDTDGEPVWWATAPASCSRAKMSWDGKEMWMQELNVDNGGGEMRKVAMDGTGAMMNITGLGSTHHDFTVLPAGGLVSFRWTGAGMDAPNELIERSGSGTITIIVPNMSTLYRGSGSGSGYHPNAIHYHQSDDSYTISDRNVNLFIKVRRNGQLVWQLGGSNPVGQAFTVSGGTWMVNHGHHLLPNGNFLFFSNGPFTNGMSQALEYSLNTTSWTATRVWQYQAQGVNSPVLSDAQRLPNGNTLVTYSTVGTIHEVTPSGQLVMSLDTTSVGYADFRESLYGPPLR